MWIMKNIIFPKFLVFSLLFLNGTIVVPNGLSKRLSNLNDSTYSILLDEVKVLPSRLSKIETEKPNRKRHFSFITIAPCQIGMMFDDVNLIGRKLTKLEIYFDKRYSPNNTFQIQIYSIGKDMLPTDLVNKHELAFSANQIGWNEFPILLEDLVIPKNGIAVIVNFFAKSNKITGETDRVAMGKYSVIKRFYVRPTSRNDWTVISSFQGGRIGPMIRLEVQ
jgi:hypothetical protein